MKRKKTKGGLDVFEDNVCNIRGDKEHERFSNILETLKRYDIIKSYKEFAENINESSVGLNDIKNGRKKLSISHVKNINTKYPFINTDFIIFQEGKPFHEDFLIGYFDEDDEEYARFYKFDLEAIKNAESNSKDISIIENKKDSSTRKPQQEDDLLKELLSTKNELLKAKDEILKLQLEIYELKLKNIN